MKQIVCEMCGGTNLVKDGGLFVCQDCGCKYSLEEARKMMQDVPGGAPAAAPAAPANNQVQLENLLKLARSSFESKNYSQAEEFCNQVLALDSQHYEAWKLKGQAINYQIGAKNQRIAEVYNCLMTAYRVCSDADKKENRYEILDILKTCFEGEVDFWLKQFEANRPTDAALVRAKNAYIDAYNKMKAAFEEMDLESAKEGYLINFDNYFVGKCNAICNSAWKTTVGYNYYRDYYGKGKDPFGRTDQRWIIKDTDLWRPLKKTWDTFLNEGDNLIALLKFAEEQFNDETNPKVMEAIYSNIAYFEECLMLSGSWKITQGYTSNWDEYKSVGWHEEYCLSDSAKAIRRAAIAKYNALEKSAPARQKAKQEAKKEKERLAKIAKYWEAHPEEKARLEEEKAQLKERLDALNQRIAEIDKKNQPQVDQLNARRKEKIPAEVEVEKQIALIKELEDRRSGLGIFKGKEKKAITDRLDTVERPRRASLEAQAAEERKAFEARLNSQIALLKEDGKELRDEAAKLSKRIAEIDNELTKTR